MEGRFQSRVSVVEGHGVNNPPESENSGGHIVVDPTRQFIFQLSKKYASPSGIVDVNEIRTWDTDLEGYSLEVVRNELSNISVPILPQEKYWWRSVPLLVLSLDQGPIGTAGMAFALQGHRIHVKFDKIHRCIRDYKLALGRAMGGVFLKTQLHSSYIFGLNYKPFNTGLFHEQKRRCLKHFSNLTIFQAIYGKNSEKELPSILAKRMSSMIDCFLKLLLNWSRSKTKAF